MLRDNMTIVYRGHFVLNRNDIPADIHLTKYSSSSKMKSIKFGLKKLAGNGAGEYGGSGSERVFRQRRFVWKTGVTV